MLGLDTLEGYFVLFLLFVLSKKPQRKHLIFNLIVQERFTKHKKYNLLNQNLTLKKKKSNYPDLNERLSINMKQKSHFHF